MDIEPYYKIAAGHTVSYSEGMEILSEQVPHALITTDEWGNLVEKTEPLRSPTVWMELLPIIVPDSLRYWGTNSLAETFTNYLGQELDRLGVSIPIKTAKNLDRSSPYNQWVFAMHTNFLIKWTADALD